jgi:hypothetical protein
MRVLGWVLAGALALTAPIGVQAGHSVWARIQCPTVGTVTGVEHPVPRVSGTADRFHRVGARIVLLMGGFAVRARGCLRTGSTFPGAQSLMILSQIGEARPAAGVIRSQPDAIANVELT